MADVIAKLRELAKPHGFDIKDCGNGHIQIYGSLLVNYYPKSRRKTAYVAQTRRGRSWVSPEEAISMAMEPPPILAKGQKRRKRNRNGTHFAHLWEKQGGRCFVCKEPMLREAERTNPLRATWEHKIPLARGGLDNANNLALSHRKCNHDRGHDMPELDR